LDYKISPEENKPDDERMTKVTKVNKSHLSWSGQVTQSQVLRDEKELGGGGDGNTEGKSIAGTGNSKGKLWSRK
jgi:hypothetical protein